MVPIIEKIKKTGKKKNPGTRHIRLVKRPKITIKRPIKSLKTKTINSPSSEKRNKLLLNAFKKHSTILRGYKGLLQQVLIMMTERSFKIEAIEYNNNARHRLF
jgi:ribosomal protein L2